MGEQQGPRGAWAGARGVGGRRAEPTAGVSVRLVPAVHGARPMPHRPNAANGHLVRGPSGVVWVAGDTELYPDLALLASWAGAPVDLALVPIAGWGPRLSPGHMGPKEAAIACRMIGARWAIPVHWNTLYMPTTEMWPGGWMSKPGPFFLEALAREAPAGARHGCSTSASRHASPTPDPAPQPHTLRGKWHTRSRVTVSPCQT